MWASAVFVTVTKGDACADHSEDQTMQFEWYIPVNQAELVRKSLVYDGNELLQREGRGAPLMIFIGVVLLTYLAQALLAFQRQIKYGGVIVDTRSDPIKITYDKALDAGVIIVVGRDQNTIIQRNHAVDPETIVRLLRSLVNGR